MIGIIITGPAKSGKTTLAKHLQLALQAMEGRKVAVVDANLDVNSFNEGECRRALDGPRYLIVTGTDSYQAHTFANRFCDTVAQHITTVIDKQIARPGTDGCMAQSQATELKDAARALEYELKQRISQIEAQKATIEQYETERKELRTLLAMGQQHFAALGQRKPSEISKLGITAAGARATADEFSNAIMGLK